MNDRERILMSILQRLQFTQGLCLHGDYKKQFEKDGNTEYVHFGTFDDRPLQIGDLVMGQTGPIDDFKIGWVHKIISFDNLIIREIGSDRLCNYSNESWKRIVGMDKSLLLEGDKYNFNIKVQKAFHRGNEFSYRFGGVDFEEDTAKIWIREAFGGMINGGTVPFSFVIPWNKKTTIKKILELMIENGYGTKKFERSEKEKEMQ